jgi:hypothetical protein
MMFETAIIAAVAGLSGVALGAWLNALLTTRRERWNLRRELYTQLIENLSEVKDALDRLYHLENTFPSSGCEQMEKEWEERIKVQQDRESKAIAEVRRVASVAAIMLGQNALDAIEKLWTEWSEAKDADSYSEHINLRTRSAKKAYELLIQAARKDLKMQPPRFLRGPQRRIDNA